MGEPPFTGEVQSILYRIVHEVPQPPRALGAEVREELQDIVLQCLQKDPAKRPQRAGHVADALRRHRASLHSDEFSRSVVLTASRVIQRPAAERPDFPDLAPDLLSLFPLLTEIPELRAAASGGSKLAAAAEERKAEDRIQIFELLARTLTRIGGGKPLVLILENLHGAEISIEALQYIVRR